MQTYSSEANDRETITYWRSNQFLFWFSSTEKYDSVDNVMSPTAQKWTATPDLNARNEEDTGGKTFSQCAFGKRE